MTPQFLQQRQNLPRSQVQNVSSSSTHPHIQLGGKPIFLTVPVPDQLHPPRYPLASSGRGFINSSSTPRPHVQLPDQTIAVVSRNPNPKPDPGSCPVPSSSVTGYPPRPFGFAPSPSPPLVKESARPYHFEVGSAACSLPDCSGGNKAPRKGSESRDYVCVSVRDRKVKISDGASMYALCRSWLRNGQREESQPQFGDIVKSLPKPAPASSSDIYSLKRNEGNEEEENNMDEKAVDSLSPRELLRLHVKRAIRVRERLREERLQRIARYKSRLALLLPPLVEQCKNDPSDMG